MLDTDCDITLLYFLLVRLFGAGVPKLQALKGRVLVRQGCVEKYRSPRGEDDFSTTPAGLDLAWTKRTRVTFACGLVNSATNLLCHFLLQGGKIPPYRCFNLKNNLYFCSQIIQELFEKRDEYGSTEQSFFFLSIANSHVSSS